MAAANLVTTTFPTDGSAWADDPDVSPNGGAPSLVSYLYQHARSGGDRPQADSNTGCP